MTKAMNQHNNINYVEFATRDLAASKVFFESVFNWTFEDFGPEYTAIKNAGLDGGLFQSTQASNTKNGAVLVVIYSDDIETTLANVISAGGLIEKSIFEFPGGKRFHFIEPGGNEIAVWSNT